MKTKRDLQQQKLKKTYRGSRKSYRVGKFQKTKQNDI
jgi:hypothetical protein